MGIAIVLALGCVFAELFLIMIFSSRYLSNSRPLSLLFLLIALILIFIGDIFALIGIFIPQNDSAAFNVLSKTSYIATILSAIAFLFFYEIFESDSLFGLKQLGFSIFGTIILASFFLHDQKVIYNSKLDVHMLVIDNLTLTLGKMLPLLIGLTVLVTIFKNYALAWQKQQNQLTFLGIGAFIGYITPHVFIEPFQSQIVGFVGPGLFMVLVRIWVALGFIIYWYSFGSSEFFGFLQKQHAQKLLMVGDGGIPLYTYNFRNRENVLEDEMLFGGAITAISSLFKETLGKTNVKDISLEDGRKLLFKPFEDKSFSIILITPKNSKYLSESMKRFGEMISKLFSNVGKLSESKKIADTGDKVVSDSFGIPK